MLNILTKLYFASFASYGFYRGFNNTFTLNSHPKLDKPHTLLTHKVLNSIFTSGMFLLPPFHPFILYHLSVRLEKKYRNIEIEDSDFTW